VTNIEHVDVLIVGAGISGIGAAHHLQKRCPDRSYLILEGRENLGGTWDLFRYPGIRSDSDMHTLGFSFKPWVSKRAIAEGDAILDYLGETATENGIDRNIRFSHRVLRANWSSELSLWQVDVENTGSGEVLEFSCQFLYMCSGYYDYHAGYSPDFEGQEQFAGEIVHPQFWPETTTWKDKQVVVIGSGATAVTVVPAMAEDAAHVTMLQRSPTYFVSQPWQDGIANFLRAWLPRRFAYFLTRWKNVLLQLWFFRLCRKHPDRAATALIDRVREELGPDYDVDTHFTPSYNPWEQRLCLVPDGDLFAAIRQGLVSVETDHIRSFNKTGIVLESGKELAADLVVTATGLEMCFLSDVEVRVDNKLFNASEGMTYRGMMIGDIPNLAFSMGYTNASWTLKADLTSAYVCRLLNHMSKHGYTQCCPHNSDPEIEVTPYLDFKSGYVQRAAHRMPQQGNRAPWRLYQNYLLDILTLRLRSLKDDVMRFS
jgi:monooxygenase